MVQTSPEEAYRKYDELTKRHIENLRKLTKAIQDARIARENEAIKHSLKEYDEALERYIPVLMAQARIYWERENYPMVERLFRQSAEFCSEHEIWKLNVAHVFFMQEGRYKEAIRYYDPIVKKHSENLLGVAAIVLANLCVSYIMTSQNEEAEELMRKIEKEEERSTYTDPDKPVFHLCIVNLVIGTLYCAKVYTYIWPVINIHIYVCVLDLHNFFVCVNNSFVSLFLNASYACLILFSID
jgi:tetratricopeptide repeat protein 30